MKYNSIYNIYRSDNDETLISEELYNNFSTELATQLEKTTDNADEKFTGMLRYRKTYLIRNEVLPTLQVFITMRYVLLLLKSSHFTCLILNTVGCQNIYVAVGEICQLLAS